jgi:hypothetical protein
VSYLLDTTVVSELTRPQANSGVVSWLEAQDEGELFLSALTIGELEKGIAKLTDAKRKARLRQWLRQDVAERFAGRVLAADIVVARHWGTLVGESERKGQPLPVIDSLIAATAIAHNLVVVSRNTSDFERCGAHCLNPWTS